MSLHSKTPLKAKTPLQRKTPLQAHSKLCARELKSHSELKAHGELKPGGVKLARKSAMKPAASKRHYGHLVRQGWCAVCGKGTLETEWHHIIYRSQGGDESDENMLEVCRECHSGIHAGRISRAEVDFARLTAGSYLEENIRTFGARG